MYKDTYICFQNKISLEGLVGLDLLDRGQTPERIEFENLAGVLDPEEGHSQMDEDEWTDRNFGASTAELGSSDDISDMRQVIFYTHIHVRIYTSSCLIYNFYLYLHLLPFSLFIFALFKNFDSLFRLFCFRFSAYLFKLLSPSLFSPFRNIFKKNIFLSCFSCFSMFAFRLHVPR